MNGKQRRQIEKSLGYIKQMKNMSKAERDEIKYKKIIGGKRIEEKNREDLLNRLMQEERERDDRVIKSLVDAGNTLEQANEILLRNKELQKKRIK